MLRALGQGIKLPLVHARGHHKITGPFRGGFDQERCLDFQETAIVQITACFLCDFVTQYHGLLQRGPSQVQVAVTGTQFFPAIGDFLNGKGRYLRRAQHTYPAEVNFNFPGGDFQVFAASFHNNPLGRDHKLTPQRFGGFLYLDRGIFFDYQLGDSIPVPQVNESHSSQFSYPLYPPGQCNPLAGARQVKFSACVCPVHFQTFYGHKGNEKMATFVLI